MGQAAQGWRLEKEGKEASGREHQGIGRGRTDGWEEGVLCLRGCEIRDSDGCCKPRAQGNGNSGLYPQGPLPRKESATTSSERNPLTTGTRSDSQGPPSPMGPAMVLPAWSSLPLFSLTPGCSRVLMSLHAGRQWRLRHGEETCGHRWGKERTGRTETAALRQMHHHV